jgi:outer membrane protein TolC
MLDVLNAQSQEANSRQQVAKAQYDALIARNNLNFSLGQTLVTPIAQGYVQP